MPAPIRREFLTAAQRAELLALPTDRLEIRGFNQISTIYVSEDRANQSFFNVDVFGRECDSGQALRRDGT
jgi:hypothetical protein